MITAAIPTYNRGEILVQTIERLLLLTPAPAAVIVADQTVRHPPIVEQKLAEWAARGDIQWLRLATPSIPRAMNDALEAATTPVVLFLDDDIVPAPDLIGGHLRAHAEASVWAVAGQVLQPGEEPLDAPPSDDDLEFAFNGSRGAFVTNVMAGNLSVRRERALAIGGFDENFTGAAYRFETDFALRLVAAGGRIWFEPSASIRHLKLSTGGLRTYGDHLTASSAVHTSGDYYFALHHRPDFWRYAGRRVLKNVVTRFHATHPWTIPGKLLAEARGVIEARRLFARGRRLRTGPVE